MHSFTRIISIPTWQLREYLEELGGHVTSDDCICGEGWEARLTQMEDAVIGSQPVTQLRMEWKGGDQALQQVWPELEQKLAGAGGRYAGGR